MFSGLLSWDVNDCLVDLEKELALISEQALEGEEARHGEYCKNKNKLKFYHKTL